MMGQGPNDSYSPNGGDETPEHDVVLAGFYLDKYEVSVSRFRAFRTAVAGGWSPQDGEGAHPHAAGVTGWVANTYTVDPDTVANCLTSPMTWTDTAGDNEDLPINCVNWSTAFAFCIWDGGRLPTEAEWEYAAAGGGLNRIFPYAPGATPPDAGIQAEYNSSRPVAVGSQTGFGFWEHFDLSGNVAEWVFDAYVPNYDGHPDPCTNYVELSNGDTRVVRGGSYTSQAYEIRAASRSYSSWSLPNAWNGFRCARDQ
jgi:sulfatase modifying factor 1